MKRSCINAGIVRTMKLCRTLHFSLPSFAYWTQEDWAARTQAQTAKMREGCLGWDVTDFGSGDFTKTGAVLFTLRNGSRADNRRPYCEKLIAMEDGQTLPCHFHYEKTEDIINRAGGTLCIRVWQAGSEASGYAIDEVSAVTIYGDGQPITVPAGGVIRVENGNSITLEPYTYHLFYTENGAVLVGEVSKVNDDRADNHFLDPHPLTIEEDEATLYPLCGGYEMQSR